MPILLYLNFPSWLQPEIFPSIPWLGFLRWYSLSYIVAFFLAYQLFMWLVNRDTPPIMTKEQGADFGLLLMICMILGGRLGYVLIYDPAYYFGSLSGFLSILLPFTFANASTGQPFAFTGISGLSYHGGVLGVVLSLILASSKLKISFWKLSDRLLPCVAAVYTFGRLGNFANQELYGKATASSLGMIFPAAEPVLTADKWVQQIGEKVGLITPGQNILPIINLPRHPSQLYESFFEGIFLGAILFFIILKWKDFAPGFVAGCYLFGYGILRFFIEYVREPDPQLGFIIKLGPGADIPQIFTSFLNLSMGQVLCLVMVVAGLTIMCCRISIYRKALAPT